MLKLPKEEKKRKRLTVLLKFEGEDMEMINVLSEYYKISTGKDLIMFILNKEYREIKKEKEKGALS